MYKKLLRTKKRPLHTISKKWRWRLNFADCPARLPVHFDSMPAFSDGIMPQKHLYPQILPTPTHVGRVWPVLTSSGVLCPVTLFLPHDPDALLHSVTVFFSVSSFLSSPSLSPSLSLHHATQFPSHATSSSRSVSTQSEVEPTPTSSLSSASTTAQSPLSSNIQPSNLFQSSKPASPASPHPPDILPGSLSTLQPPASGRVSSTRASGLFLNTQPQQLVQSSAPHSDSPASVPQCPDILLESKPPLHPATSLSLQQHALLACETHLFPRHSPSPHFIMSPFPPLPASSGPLMPPATVCVSQTRDSSPFLTTQPLQLAMTSSTPLDSLGFNPPSLPLSIIAPSSTSSIFTLKYFPPELDFHVYLALRASKFLDELLLMHVLATQDDDRLVAPFVHHARRAFDARFRDWAPEVTGRARSLPMACPPPPRPLAADPART